jgi:hypothetical protein
MYRKWGLHVLDSHSWCITCIDTKEKCFIYQLGFAIFCMLQINFFRLQDPCRVLLGFSCVVELWDYGRERGQDDWLTAREDTYIDAALILFFMVCDRDLVLHQLFFTRNSSSKAFTHAHITLEDFQERKNFALWISWQVQLPPSCFLCRIQVCIQLSIYLFILSSRSFLGIDPSHVHISLPASPSGYKWMLSEDWLQNVHLNPEWECVCLRWMSCTVAVVYTSSHKVF